MIGKKLKEYRLSLKFTGDTLANLAGIKRSYLSQIENEKKVPPFDTFMDLVNAIAKISPLNDENSKSILTEDRYQEFKALLKISVLKRAYDDIPDNEIYVTAECTMPDNPNIEFDFIIEKTNIKDVTKQDIDKGIRKEFFEWDAQEDLSFSGVPVNLASDYYFYITVYEIPEVRTALYEWWYNHILKDFRNTIVHDEISKQERELANSILTLENSDGTFTPGNEEGNINLSKELLDGKIVSFELKYFKDKNVRLFLDGKMLSNQELNSLNVSINAIRYDRTESEKPVGFDSPEEFEEYRSKIFKKYN